ncbi:uncharacterized protein LOC143590427 [Bidens hawaiensis]|uniref:uncharacterized protein LOC143590427 n=1 Tax=Bidens hawaiensis TaxID=980011 RepID=UPI00404904E2
MHKIISDPEVKPAHDAQRRLNPNMREVVKKEVLKWLDPGIIFPISDSTWESPTQTVPKKAGIQITCNERGEEIATRPVTGWRICVDYRKLNAATSKDHFPLPYIDQIIEKLSEGTVLGHVISSRGIEVDRAKVNVISNLPPPTNIKGIRSFWGHAGFYRRFIKYFSVITKPLCNMLLKDVPFVFDEDCLNAFNVLKNK